MAYTCAGCSRQFESPWAAKKCHPPCDFIIRVELTPEQRLAIGAGNFASQRECSDWANGLIIAGIKALEGSKQ